MLLSLNQISELDKNSIWFGYNRPALLSFYNKDHGARDGTDPRLWVKKHLTTAGLVDAGSDIRLLCFPRVLGYVFNPLSIYFCHSSHGQLQAILYEVKNTFGEQHGYLFPIENHTERHQKHTCSKSFYVSPFLGMDAKYDFDITLPQDDFSLFIRQTTSLGETLQATWRGQSVPWSNSALRHCFWSFPLLTLKIMWGIHWHAIVLYLKNAKFHHRPVRPINDVSVIDERPLS